MWIFDVGFQLSYSALLAIMYFEPKIASWLTFRHKPLKYIWELTAVSLAAQLGTVPLCMYYFHKFPNYFLIANYVVVPFGSLIIYSAVFLFIVSKIPLINVFAATLLEWVVKIMYYCIKFIENLPNALSINWLNGYQTLLFYLMIFALGFLFIKIKFKYILFLGSFAILFFTSILLQNIDNQKVNQLIIFNDNKNLTLNIINSEKNFVYASDFESAEKIAQTLWMRRNCKEVYFQQTDTNEMAKIVQFDNKNFVILTQKNILKKLPDAPLDVDYLVVNKNIFPSKDIFESYFKPKTIITTGDVYENNNKKFAVLAEEYGINFYPVRTKGAFVLTIENND